MNSGPAGFYLILCLVAVLCSVVLWWRRPVLARRLVSLLEDGPLLWVGLGFLLTGLALLAFFESAPPEVGLAFLFLGVVGSILRMTSIPFRGLKPSPPSTHESGHDVAGKSDS